MNNPGLPLPPESELQMFGGAEGFIKKGPFWVRYFQDSCGLKPDDQVLDVGCGVGCIAIPLAEYLTAPGSYEGIDIVPERVNWCRENIASRWPNFHFDLADIYNWANPTGALRAKDCTFPFKDEQFDFVFLISVFTHMLPPGVEHYLFEIARVLKKGGRCLISFLLLNEESLGLLEAGRSRTYELPHDFGTYRLHSTRDRTSLVAYREDFVLDLFRKARLEIKTPIQYGSWPGRNIPDEDFILQDCVLAHRPEGWNQRRIPTHVTQSSKSPPF